MGGEYTYTRPDIKHVHTTVNTNDLRIRESSDLFFFVNSYRNMLVNIAVSSQTWVLPLHQNVKINLLCKHLDETNDSVLSHDVMEAIFVSKNKETEAIFVSQTNPVGVELFSYVNAFFCSNKFA